MNICKIKNIDVSTGTYAGKELQVAEEYLIPDTERTKWSSDSSVVSAITGDKLQVGDGGSYFTSYSDQVRWLNNFSGTYNADGSMLTTPGIRRSSLASTVGRTIVSHDFGDQTTWYQYAVQVVDEVMTDSGDGLTFNSLKNFWINIDSDRINYDKDLIQMKDGTYKDHPYFRPVIQIDAVIQTSGYTINYTTGDVTFDASQTGKVVKATFFHTDGIANRSNWILNPPAGKKYIIEHVELQFSKLTTFSNIIMEAWAGGSIATYEGAPGAWSDTLYDAGYGQERSTYKGIKSLINVCNQGTGVINTSSRPDFTDDILIFPFFYTYAMDVDSAVGTLVRFALEDDIALSNCESRECYMIAKYNLIYLIRDVLTYGPNSWSIHCMAYV